MEESVKRFERSNGLDTALYKTIPLPLVMIKLKFNLTKLILTRFNKIVIQGTPQMAADKETIILSRGLPCYSNCNLPLF